MMLSLAHCLEFEHYVTAATGRSQNTLPQSICPRDTNLRDAFTYLKDSCHMYEAVTWIREHVMNNSISSLYHMNVSCLNRHHTL